jgi:hypothetical protein
MQESKEDAIFPSQIQPESNILAQSDFLFVLAYRERQYSSEYHLGMGVPDQSGIPRLSLFPVVESVAHPLN